MAFIFVTSCNTTKFLKEDEILLKSIDIKIESEDKVEKRSKLKDELKEFNFQEPNSKFLFVPREWYYFRNQDPGDTTWIKNWIKKALAEEPAILDSALIKRSGLDMEAYLRNKKGFYKANVRDDISVTRKTASVIYNIDPGIQYTINSLHYIVLDTTLLPVIESLKANRLLNVGDPIDALAFDLELQRLVTGVQNHGYADFNLSHIDIKGDSTGLDRAVDIFLEISKPYGTPRHKKFTIGDIAVYTDYHQFQLLEKTTEEFVYDKLFKRESKKFIVRPGAIDGKIFLKKGEDYKVDNYYKTLRKLSSLGTYRFAKISPIVNPSVDTIINYNILLTPHNKKWIFDYGSDIFYSTVSRVGRNLIGFSVGAGLQNRNFFGGSEQFKIAVETGVEFEITQPIMTNAFSLNIQNTLDVPRFMEKFNMYKALRRVNILKDKGYRSLKDESSTNYTLSYNFINLLDNYNISSFKATLSFDYRPNKNHRLTFNQTGFVLNQYDIKPQFQQILDTIPLLKLSFENSLFSGIFFRNLSYFYQSPKSASGFYWAFLSNLELSGLEIFLANNAYNAFANENKTFKLNNTTDFSNFIKLELDARIYKQIIKNSVLATRLNVGIAVPYFDDDVVNYIKQVYVGGPNTIRAWQQRELGPGSYSKLLESPIPGQDFFQTGDIKLVFNVEYRFDLFWILEGALFLDGGNVWTLREDTARPGAQLNAQFIKDIALGTGFGLRWDFTYFNIRFDFGYKLKNSYQLPETNSYWQSPFRQGIGNVNVAVNYPF